MPQNRIVMAFRKRLKSRGYTDIEIYRKGAFQSIYVVRCVEPLAHLLIRIEMTSIEMDRAMRT